MAFGFSPKYIRETPLQGMEKQRFLAIAMEATKRLGWKLGSKGDNGFSTFTEFSWSSWSEEVSIEIENDFVKIKSECTGNQLIDWGKNKENVESLLASIEDLKATLSDEELEKSVSELQQEYELEKNVLIRQSPSSSKSKISGLFSIFSPKSGYFISPILIAINVVVFIAMIISGVHFMSPDNQSLLNWGANFKPYTLEGEWWRLITACFVHIGVLHLLLNMYALLYIGLLLEPYLGKARFLSAYMIAGLAASLTSLWWHDLTISAGASGAVFGMYGVFLALLSTNLIDKSTRTSLLPSIFVFVAFNIFNGIKEDSGIDNAAHIGGLLSGLVMGYSFIPGIKNPQNNRLKYGTISIMIVVIVAGTLFMYRSSPNDMGRYEKEMEKFVTMENMALYVFRMPEEATNEEVLKEIKERGIYYWHENIKLLDDVDELELPGIIVDRNKMLRRYCELRIKAYELMYKAVNENTDKYTEEINSYNERIADIISNLVGNK